jgi:hypothetical protein
MICCVSFWNISPFFSFDFSLCTSMILWVTVMLLLLPVRSALRFRRLLADAANARNILQGFPIWRLAWLWPNAKHRWLWTKLAKPVVWQNRYLFLMIRCLAWRRRLCIMRNAILLSLALSSVTTSNLIQIRSARYVFHCNPRTVVAIYIT